MRDNRKFLHQIPSLPKKTHGHFFFGWFLKVLLFGFFGICSSKVWKVWKGWDELGHYSFDLEHFACGYSNLTGVEEAFKINEEIRDCSAKTSSTSSSAWSYLIISTRFFHVQESNAFISLPF